MCLGRERALRPSTLKYALLAENKIPEEFQLAHPIITSYLSKRWYDGPTHMADISPQAALFQKRVVKIRQREVVRLLWPAFVTTFQLLLCTDICCCCIIVLSLCNYTAIVCHGSNRKASVAS
jgi:hypothetical protein